MSYTLISPPADVPVADVQDWKASSLVLYEQHPAYAPLIESAGFALKVRALRRFVPSYIVIKLKRAIRYEMIPLHIRKPKGGLGWIRLLAAALQHLLQFQRPRNVSVSEPGLQPLDQTFRRNGCAVVAMSGVSLEEIDRLSGPNFARLEERRAMQSGGVRDFEASRSYARRDEQPELFSAIESAFSHSGVTGAAEAYLGRKVRLIDVNPQINDPSDDFWRRIFPDLDLPQPESAYFHRDASGGDIKAIIYMSDVGADNGPFGYVLGTHLMPLDRTDDHISEANDSNGLAGTGAENRRCFAALPAALRQKGAFGNDVVDTSPVNAVIQESLWSITGKKGSIVMFDTKGVHRGGMVLAGERRVITCVLG